LEYRDFSRNHKAVSGHRSTIDGPVSLEREHRARVYLSPDNPDIAVTIKRVIPAVLLLVAIVGATPAGAQELDCRVSVNFSALTGTEFTFLGELANQIEDYLNQRSWTEDRFQDHERIACNLGVTITEAEGLDRFRARLTVGSQRPIWGTMSRTQVFQIVDNSWHFTYNRGQAMVHDPNRFNSLTSLIDFYAYLILGYDYDTFDEFGGTPFFEQARRISELAQGQGAQDWQAIGDDQSRGTLIRQLLDARFQSLRQAYYLYHFAGLDRFTTDHEAGWEAAAGAIEQVHELYLETSRRYAIDVFFVAKSTEISEFFVEFPGRTGLYSLLVDMDPGRASAYDRLTR